MDDLFNIAKMNTSAPQKGRLLISEPFMEDNFFKRAVIFLCEHNEDGSFGFVLNNNLSISMNDVIEDFDGCEMEVGFGGPVNTSNLYYIHTLGDRVEGSIEVFKGIYTGGDFGQIKSLIKTGLVNENQIRFFLGYSGWSSGQLQTEIEGKSWIVGENVSKESIIKMDECMWKRTLNQMGGKFKMLANFPENPSLN